MSSRVMPPRTDQGLCEQVSASDQIKAANLLRINAVLKEMPMRSAVHGLQYTEASKKQA